MHLRALRETTALMQLYRIDATAGIVELLGPGGIEDLEARIRGVLADPAYRRGFGFLRDRRGMPPPSTTELRAMVDFLGRFEALYGSRWAVVATDPVNFGMMRMGEILAEPHGINVAVFSDEVEAVRWLTERPESVDQPGRGFL